MAGILLGSCLWDHVAVMLAAVLAMLLWLSGVPPEVVLAQVDVACGPDCQSEPLRAAVRVSSQKKLGDLIMTAGQQRGRRIRDLDAQ